MHRFLFPLFVLLLHSTLSAQPATRLGVYEGIGFSNISYDFLGQIYDRDIESMPIIGLMLEFPLSGNILLSIRPAMTTLNGSANLFARFSEETGSPYYHSSIKEQWILEAPILLKYVLKGEEIRPCFSLGGYLDINGNPAEIRVTKDHDPSYSEATAYPTLTGGLIAAIGMEIETAPMFLIIPEFGIRQQFSPPIDTELLTQHNNPRFFFSVGIVFTLNHERWR